MPLFLLLVAALTVGCSVALAAWRYPRIAKPAATPSLDAKLDSAAATGLALTVALILAVGGGLLLGLLAYLVRTSSQLIVIDNGVAKWGHRHASATSMHLLNDITHLGAISTVVVLCVVLAVTETIRERSVWVTAFIVAVIGGEEILSTTIKQLADRVRPVFNPAAATLGPSFPSGHSTTAAAFYAAAALLLGRGRTRPTRAALTGLAAGIAVAVAASSRTPRRSLAVGRGRRPRARLGLVRDLRNRLRRTTTPLPAPTQGRPRARAVARGPRPPGSSC